MNDKIEKSSENVFIDLGFSPKLATRMLEEAKEISLKKTNPDISLLLEFRKTIKIKIKEINANVDRYRKEVSTAGDYRDSNWCDVAEENLNNELIKLRYYKEFSNFIKEFANYQYGNIND